MSPYARRRVVVLFLAVSVALAACSTTGATSPPPARPQPDCRQPQHDRAQPERRRRVPRHADRRRGHEVDLAAEPQVIVSLTPATTEILFADRRR